ncbi:MAG: hypothetical protein AB1400_07925 [Pseudomonadota bacterium]
MSYSSVEMHAGSGPARRSLFCFAKKVSKKGDPGLPPLRGALRRSNERAAAELALRARAVLAVIPVRPARLGGKQGAREVAAGCVGGTLRTIIQLGGA